MKQGTKKWIGYKEHQLKEARLSESTKTWYLNPDGQ